MYRGCVAETVEELRWMERERERGGGCPLRPKIRSSSEDQRSERIVDFFSFFLRKKRVVLGQNWRGQSCPGVEMRSTPFEKRVSKQILESWTKSSPVKTVVSRCSTADSYHPPLEGVG